MSEKEAEFKAMVAEFPDAAMAHFSLGKVYLDESRWREAAASFSTAVKLDDTYAAAWVALGDAWAGAGQSEEAKAAWNRALSTPLGKRDASLQSDLADRVAELSRS